MSRSAAAELPAEVLQRIFSSRWPGHARAAPVLDAKEQLRCQLVCKAWRLALDPRRWPLCQLELEACVDRDRSPLAAPAALWVQRMRPGVRDLRIELSGYDGYAGFVEEGKASVTWDSPAVQAAHGALLALQPLESLHSLSLTAPFPVLERFLQALGRFTGLRRLELRAEMRYMDDEDETIRWDTQALLLPELLQPLPPQLEGLTVANFYGVGLEEELPADDTAAAPAAGAAAASAAAVGNAGAAGSQAPAPTPLPPGLSWLSIRNARLALLDMPLPGLAAVTIDECSQVCLKGDRLQLPQLTSLQLCCSCPANAVRFGAMPALAQLACSGRFRPSDSFAALQRLASLDLILMGGSLQNAGAMVKAVAPSLRSLRAEVRPWHNHHLVQQAAATLEAAGASQLTRLELNGRACLAHLPAWPHLQELQLARVRPTSIGTEQQAQLAAATSLRHLAFCYSLTGPIDYEAASREQTERLQELRLALSCTVERYWTDC